MPVTFFSTGAFLYDTLKFVSFMLPAIIGVILIILAFKPRKKKPPSPSTPNFSAPVQTVSAEDTGEKARDALSPKESEDRPIPVPEMQRQPRASARHNKKRVVISCIAGVAVLAAAVAVSSIVSYHRGANDGQAAGYNSGYADGTASGYNTAESEFQPENDSLSSQYDSLLTKYNFLETEYAGLYAKYQNYSGVNLDSYNFVLQNVGFVVKGDVRNSNTYHKLNCEYFNYLITTDSMPWEVYSVDRCIALGYEPCPLCEVPR